MIISVSTSGFRAAPSKEKYYNTKIFRVRQKNQCYDVDADNRQEALQIAVALGFFPDCHIDIQEVPWVSKY